ncbi:MAG: MFS transporter [Alphaproteobacteria bacterium]|nr:MFS transporter [Alphaproteobacteria bacterium]MBU2379364.1 MFS transporter [Alphaproteobacteria bacterium]
MIPTSTDAPASPAAATPPGAGKWIIVGLLWVAYFLNQADRQIFSVTLPLIQADFHLSSAQMGLVATVFTLVFGLTVPFAGFAGDIIARYKVVVLSLIVFSAGTLFTGLASSYLLLLLFRGVATGTGEAMYAPAANSMIGEQHVSTRGRALSLHQTANYTGIVLGSLFAGWIAETHGWRWSFAVFGVAGLIWAGILFVFARRITARSAAAAEASPPADRARIVADAVKAVITSPLLLAQILGFSALIFVMVGYLTWTPSLLLERFGLSLSQAGFFAVLYHHLFAAVGLLATGMIADRLVGRRPKIRLLAMSSGLVLFAPFLWLAGASQQVWLVYAGLAGFGLFRGVYDANLFAAIFDAVDNRLRSTVTGIVVAVAYVAGAASPFIMGALKARYGLEGGFTLLAAVALVSGLIFLGIVLATRVVPADRPGTGGH